MTIRKVVGQKNATLREVAALAGVSLKTASNVINERSAHYSEETYNNVMKAAVELGYIPNIAARHLRLGKTGIIALVIPEIRNPYFTEIADNIINAAVKHNSTVLIDFTKGDREKEYEVVSGLHQLTVDGIIMDVISLDTKDLSNLSNTPLVLLGERLIDAPFDHVSIDNVAAAHVATKHLIDLGRKRIAPIGFIGGDSRGMPFFRMEGFTAAMDEANLPIYPEYMIPAKNLPFVFDRSHGEIIMRRLLAINPVPDAVFCFNDLVALGAIRAITAAGLKIPDDIAVVGFDDITEARYAVPSLTTISPDKKGIAENALVLLNERINRTRSEPKIITLSFKLTARRSTIGDLYSEEQELIYSSVGTD
jgi:DNA-binding LacI/PurR family transcriptional regulator